MGLIARILLSAVLLLLARGQTASVSANFTAPGNISVPMIVNSQPLSDFTLISSTFDCSLSSIYTYWQTPASLQANAPTNIVITSSAAATVSLQTKYNILQPTISAKGCPAPGCSISITNNCQEPIHYLNYFDIF